jgi:hypothetical protein
MNISKTLTHKQYLGDSVYAGSDGYQIWIWLNNGMGESNHIALDADTLDSLIAYAMKLKEKRS